MTNNVEYYEVVMEKEQEEKDPWTSGHEDVNFLRM